MKIGRLRCSGETEINIPPSSCKDLKKMGETRTGLYVLEDVENENYPVMSFCDMNTPGYEDVIESKIGWLKFRSGPREVVFCVTHSGINDIPTGATITYDVEVVNKGSAMNLKEGVFTAVTSGLYEFKFSGMTYPAGQLRIDIMLNGNVYIETVNSYDSYSSENRVWLLNLHLGDTVHLVKTAGGLYWNVYVTEFIGVLL